MERPWTHRVAVCVFLVDEEDRVLLFERTNTDSNRGAWVVGGGHVDPHESVLHAAVREMHEELGVEIDESDLEPAGVIERPALDDADWRIVQIFFVARRWKGEPRNMEPEKHGDPQWFDKDSLPVKFHPFDKMIYDRNFQFELTVL